MSRTNDGRVKNLTGVLVVLVQEEIQHEIADDFGGCQQKCEHWKEEDDDLLPNLPFNVAGIYQVLLFKESNNLI